MLPLCFISDVFVLGAAFPPLLDRISWFFPLRHAINAMTTAAANDVVGSGLAWDHLGAMLVWTAAGFAVVRLRFSWEHRAGAAPGKRRGRVVSPVGAGVTTA